MKTPLGQTLFKGCHSLRTGCALGDFIDDWIAFATGFTLVGLRARGQVSLLHPRTVFDHPRDLLAHPSLSVSEKRAILASWGVSIAASCPALRAPAGLKAPVTIDEMLEALCELDGGRGHPPGGKPNRLRSTSRALAA